MIDFKISRIEDINSLPKEIEIANKSFYLVKDKDKWKLLSSICPHMGGKAIIEEDCFRCPLHDWKFDIKTGKCFNALNEELSSYKVIEKEGDLIALLPKALLKHVNIKETTKEISKFDLKIKLHAHSCLELIYNDFSILTDPWIEGPAFMGAWLHYPKPLIKVKNLQPDIIWISHEHSDHFHEPTLKKINKNVPVFFPDFPNRRIEKKLTELGFKNINPMPFGKTFNFNKDIKITCFEPASLWNDSIVLIEFDELKFLNINDAGLNERIADIVYPVDIVASAFTWGASGYPLTWEHVNDLEKKKIIENSNNGMLEMLGSAIDLYGANYLIPYAGHFTLWHPVHINYLDKISKNTVDDVVEYLKKLEVKVLNLLPGEGYDFKLKDFKRIYGKRDRIFKKSTVKKYIERSFTYEYFQKFYPKESFLTNQNVIHYFLKFNKTNEIAFCEDLHLKIEVYFPNRTEELFFLIENGRIELSNSDRFELKIGISSEILKEIIDNNISWDEAHIGYWCKLDRTPDIFHPNFWRMLQAPYFRKKTKSIDDKTKSLDINGSYSIQELLDKHGENADRLLRRYGLFCVGCQRANQETIFQGAKTHGLNDKKTKMLITELNNLN